MTPKTRLGMVTGGAAGLLLAGYLAAAAAFAGEVPRGGDVAGVDVGGLDRAAAVARVEQAGRSRSGPLTLAAGDRTATLDPAAAGLTVDAAAAVDDLIGPALAPATLWSHLTGGGRSVAGGVDAARLTAAVTAAAKESLDVEPRDGGLTFSADGAAPVAPVVGRRVDVPAAVAAVRGRWLTATGPIEVPARTAAPTVDQAAVDRAVAGIGGPATSGPLRVTVGDRSVELPVAAFAPALRTTPGEGGALALAVDGKRLAAALLKADPDVATRPKDARIVLSGGRPTVVPGVDGVTVDPAGFATAAVKGLLATGPARVVEAPVTREEPDLTTAEAQALGVKERTSTFATNLTDNAGRTENLRIAARTVNGTVVMPGETFSLNGVLGERTAAKGYNPAPAIQNGRLVLDYGGGVSQMATTIFNNVFFSGLEDVYHKPHSFYISRYPEGREATVNWPTVDLKWKNDSPYAVLIQAWVDDQVHVSFWSTKRYDIKATKGPRTNFRTPKTVYDDKPGCVPQEASPGFDVTVGRIFTQDGKVVRRETFRAAYIAEDRVICDKEPKKTEPSPGPSGRG